MALAPCRECGAEISTEAAACPRCGVSAPTLYTRGGHMAERAVTGGLPHGRSSTAATSWARRHPILTFFGALFALGWVGSVLDGPKEIDHGMRAAAAAPPATPEQRKASFMEKVDRELASTADGITTSDGGTVAMLATDVALFSVYAGMLKEAKSHALTPDEAAKVARLRSRVVAAQRRAFPAMRRAWATAVGREVWVDDVTVQATGRGNRTVRFTGATFAANRNIQRAQTDAAATLCGLRFRRSEYRWYRSASEYSYYDMDCPPDDAVAVFHEGLPEIIAP